MRTTPPFRADHVGSLLRPPSLLAARDDFAAGRIDAAHLRADRGRRDRRRRSRCRRDVGLQSATDGEFRRASWHMDFIYQLGGISKAPGNLAVKFRNPSGNIEFTPAALHVGSRIRLDHTIFADDFRYLQSVVARRDAQAHDPVAEHGALPRRSRLHRPRRLPGHGASSGPTCPPPTPTRCSGWPRSAAPTCSSTTPAWPT